MGFAVSIWNLNQIFLCHIRTLKYSKISANFSPLQIDTPRAFLDDDSQFMNVTAMTQNGYLHKTFALMNFHESGL